MDRDLHMQWPQEERISTGLGMDQVKCNWKMQEHDEENFARI
jgi:hypothetical protein